MIIKMPYGVSPSYDLTINDASVDYQALNRMCLTLEENKHDMLKISLAGIPTRAVTEYLNRGVRLTFDTGAGYFDSFSGYVTEVIPLGRTSAGLMNNSPFQDVTVVCMGASYDMRGAKSRVWTSSKLEDVAIALADEHGFSVDVPKGSLVYPTIIQDNESDWQFLVRYAGLQGLSVSAHNTHIHVYDPHKAPLRNISFNKLVTSRGARGSSSNAPGRVTTFKGRFAGNNSDGVTVNSVVTVQHTNGDTFDVSTRDVYNLQTKAPARTTARIDHPVDNYAEAEQVLHKASREHYDYEADVECIGLAGCQPGGVISLDNYGADYDGLWYVKSVSHTLTSGVFLSDLSIAKNLRSELDSQPGVAPLVTPPTPEWGDKWQTSRRRINVY